MIIPVVLPCSLTDQQQPALTNSCDFLQFSVPLQGRLKEKYS